MSKFDKQFELVTINGMTAPHRLVFEPMGNYYAELEGEKAEAEFDHLVLSLGMRPTAAPAWTVELGVLVIEAGDSTKVGRIQEAMTGGYDAARSIA